jgi:DNA-binding NarL/FixJ family response regulator
MPVNRLRIGIADDAVVVRRGIAAMLRDEGFEVVFEVADATALLDAIAANPPDVAIVDIRMPPSHTDEGVRAAEQIYRDHPNVAVLLLSQYVDESLAMRLLTTNQEGTGYLLKERVTEVEILTEAIHRVATGGTVIDQSLVESLMAKTANKQLLGLTDRETEVLSLLAQGFTDKSIADRLFMSVRTVEVHIGSIFRKLELPNGPELNKRVRAALWFLRNGTEKSLDANP